MFNKEDRSKIKACVGVMIFKDGKILLGKRKGSHGVGEYAIPGGHLEFGESFEECIRREIKEETNLEIKNIRFLSLANIFRHENRQDMLGSFQTDWAEGEAKLMEPEKCEGWDWYSLENLPSPLFYPTEVAIDSHKTGKIFYDKE
jgi:8-oxo-dGTP diphosphatase